MAAAFACVVAGRAPSFLSVVDGTQGLQHTFNVEQVASVNHLTVFCTSPIPPEAGATVFFHFPGQDQTAWKVLGVLSADRPSAIYAVRGKQHLAALAAAAASSGFAADVTTATLGVLVEPLAAAQARLASNAMDTGNGNVNPGALVLKRDTPDAVALVTALCKNLINYLSGFAQAVSDPSQPQAIVGSYVDMSLLERWGREVTAKCRNAGAAWLLKDDDP